MFTTEVMEILKIENPVRKFVKSRQWDRITSEHFRQCILYLIVHWIYTVHQ